MTHLKIDLKDIIICGYVFLCENLLEIEFCINGTFNIERDAFVETSEFLKVTWPQVVQCIIDGKFGTHTLPGDRLPVPTIHARAFSDSSTEQKEYCKLCSQLCLFWKWLDTKEKKHTNILSDCFQNKVYDYLCIDDIHILRQVSKLVPPPPNDFIDAVINHLHSYDCIFNNIPKDIIWNVVQYMS